MAVAVYRSYYESALRLQPKESQLAMQFVLQFEANPAHPGLSLERLNHSNKAVWSGRVSKELRAILYQLEGDWAVLHVDHHDAAYRWAERRQVEVHPTTGALQVLEAVEGVVTTDVSAPGLFRDHADDYLLSLGVPPSWLPTVRKIQDEGDLLKIVDRLPQEVGERLMALSDGELVTPPVPAAPGGALSHPDTQRRFYLIGERDEFERLMSAPLAHWIAYLHPDQKRLAEGAFKGALKVTGSAGTGKTTVALHRARHLARQGKRVLLTSYVTTLCENLERNLRLFCSAEELGRITVSTVHSQALQMVRQVRPGVQPLMGDAVKVRLTDLAQGSAWDAAFLVAEWENVVRANDVSTWEQYRDVRRVGRGRSLSLRDRKQIWTLFERLLQGMQADGVLDFSGLCAEACDLLRAGKVQSPFDAVIVDELQDLRVQEIRLLAALAGEGMDRLTVVGDAGQRIYGGSFSLLSLGIDTRGRSHVLRLNYRTTEQIRKFADRLLGGEVEDLAGGKEHRGRTHSLFGGPEPVVREFRSEDEQGAFVADEIAKLLSEGVLPSEMAVFARSRSALKPLRKVLADRRIRVGGLQEEDADAVLLDTMHRAKGLEFKVVFVYGCSEDQMPHQYTLSQAADPADRELLLENERRLLYVALTRARDQVFVTAAGRRSPFVAEQA